jgi:hypothetical protein
MAPQMDKECLITWDGNGYEGTMSAEAAGLTASLYALNHLANHTRQERIIDLYYDLLKAAMDHPEAAEIMGAID